MCCCVITSRSRGFEEDQFNSVKKMSTVPGVAAFALGAGACQRFRPPQKSSQNSTGKQAVMVKTGCCKSKASLKLVSKAHQWRWGRQERSRRWPLPRRPRRTCLCRCQHEQSLRRMPGGHKQLAIFTSFLSEQCPEITRYLSASVRKVPGNCKLQ